MNTPAPRTGAPTARYVGRFAPSPTGALHAGSMVAALASWLDARAHGGRWLVRIEDVDAPRCVPGAEAQILKQLHDCGLVPDEPPLRQSERGAHYAAALQRLVDAGLAYPCACSRSDIETALRGRGEVLARHAERIYPGTCRPEHGGLRGRAARAWRLRTARSDGRAWHDVRIDWSDRRIGPQAQSLAQSVGDFVLKRADGLWAYQLAVVVDDAAQGVSDVVRGEDLADNTPRQIWLQRCLGQPTPRYLHAPLVRAADGEKLSKQNGAVPVDTHEPRAVLSTTAAQLELAPIDAATVGDWLAGAVAAWRARWL